MKSLSEAAEYLGMSPSGLRKLVKRGQIEYFQHGSRGRIKFKEEWLNDFIEAHAVRPRQEAPGGPRKKNGQNHLDGDSDRLGPGWALCR